MVKEKIMTLPEEIKEKVRMVLGEICFDMFPYKDREVYEIVMNGYKGVNQLTDDELIECFCLHFDLNKLSDELYDEIGIAYDSAFNPPKE